MQEAPPLLSKIEESAVGAWVRESLWGYPAAETVHVLGIVVLVGAAVMFDLRLLGMARRLPVSGLARHLLRWSQASLPVVVASGLLLFAADATVLAESMVFRVKLILIVLAGLNAGLFHWFTFPSVAAWDQDVSAPLWARGAAVASLVLWTGVVICGQLIAYF